MVVSIEEFDIDLVGMPDEVFVKADETLYLVDYKTAKNKEGSDPFMPFYSTQLLGYQYLLKESGIGDVSSASLVYFSNGLEAYKECPLKLLTKKGISVPFEVSIHEVELNPDDLWPLLQCVRDCVDLNSPPEGLEGCKDCQKLQPLLDMEYKMRDAEERFRQASDYGRMQWREKEQRRDKAKLAGSDVLSLTDSIVDGYTEYAPYSWDL